MAPGALAQCALEERRQRAGGKSKPGGVGAARRIPEQERLGSDEGRKAVQRTRAELHDLLVAVAPEAMAIKRLPHALARALGHALRRAVEEMLRPLLPILVVEPA